MNPLVMPPTALIPAEDPPALSDFDLLDLHTLSSPVSWVSNIEHPHTTAHAPDPLPVSSAVKTHPLAMDPAVLHPYPSPAPIAAHPQHVFDDMQRHHAVAAALVTNIPSEVSDMPVLSVPSLPDCGQIVDSALEFQSPISPVSPAPLGLSNSAVNDVVQAVESSLLPTPYSTHSVLADQSALPPPSTPVYSSARPDSLPSPASVTSNQCTSPATSRCTAMLTKSFTPNTTTTISHGRIQKQARRYTAPKSSRYCHLCARHERSVTMVPCGNVELGLCQKSVCNKCIDVYKLQVSDSSWACPHCQNRCPSRAKCFAYDRQTARRREKTMKAKMSAISQSSSEAIQATVQ